jgi:hypothetical protein
MEWVLDLGLIGACLLILYFNRKPRPAWALPIAIGCLVIAAVIVFAEVSKPRRQPEKPLPNVAEIRKTFEISAVTATNDFGYRADGFSVNIPEGYRYLKSEEPMLLLASRADRGTAIIVFRHELGSDDPEALVRKSLELLKKGNSTYKFSSLSIDPSQLRTWFRVTKNGVPLRGLLIFVPRSGKLWQLTLTEPATADDASLYRIAQTWTVD